jgi:hypothetical protein
MLLRAGGVDIALIALWLGHESTKTTSVYEHADPALKAGNRPHRPARHQTRSIPARQRATRVPRPPLIMPSSRSPKSRRAGEKTPTTKRQLGITSRSA